MKKVLLKLFKLFIKLHVYFLLITSVLVVSLNFINPPTTTMMIYRKVFAPYKLKQRRFVKLKDIPNHTKRMLMISEDSKFKTHFGFDFEAISKAFKRNKKSGRIRIGGSTLTQQVSRSIFLTTHRNLFRKYLEAWITIEMEVFLSKNRIMELYFNYVEWGKGIFGIETASYYYYDHSVKHNTTEQSKKLITVLANPIKYNPRNYSNSRTMRKRYAHIGKWYYYR